MKVAMTVAAGAFYSAAYVAPERWCVVCLLASAVLVHAMRGMP